jgi:hypothetical protein
MSAAACKDEQLMEMEALESLFPVELERVSDTECKLTLVPFSDISEVNHVSVIVKFSFPEMYPIDSTLEYVIEKTTGCIATDSSRLEDLDSTIRDVCEGNAGCCCVYQIAERVQEWLRDNNEEEKSLHDMLTSTTKQVKKKPQRTVTESDSEYDEDEDSDYDYSDEDDSDYDSDDYRDEDDEPEFKELEQKILCTENERVTREQFQQWKIAEFDIFLLKNEFIKRVADGDTRKTGKQEFLETLMSRRDAKTESSGSQSLEFNENLFDGEDDVEFDEEDE